MNTPSNFTHNMSTESALKVPLMGDLNVDVENKNWGHFADFQAPPQNIFSIRTTILRVFVTVHWILLVLLAVWNQKLWNEAQQCKAKYYIRPELSYSESPFSPGLYLSSTSHIY
jgi:hypothetical protein